MNETRAFSSTTNILRIAYVLVRNVLTTCERQQRCWIDACAATITTTTTIHNIMYMT